MERTEKCLGRSPAAGRVMVCVSASPFSTQLIRAARRLASGLQAEFLAVHIETSQRRFPLGDKERERILRNLRLAEELGGKTLTVVGRDLVEEILEVARTHNVTAIVVGKSGQRNWQSFWRGSVLESLIRRSGGINVYLVESCEEKEENPSIMTARSSADFGKWGHFAGGLTMTLLVTAVGYLGQEKVELVNVALLYLLPVLLTAVWWGRWPSYFTAVSSMFCFNFFFVPPIFNLSVYDIRHIWSFGIFLVVSFLLGGRTELLRVEARMARQREKSVRSLYQFSREITGVIDLEKIYSELVNQIRESIGRKVLVLCPNNEGRLQECGGQNGNEKVLKELTDSEYGAVSWSFENGRVAGRTTETLPGAQNLYIPLKAGAGVFGVLGIDIGMQPLSPEERRLIEAWAGLAAMAVERVNLVQEAQKAALLLESDRLRTAIFNSISHELRTPLATIIGAASSLSDKDMMLNEQAKLELLETILDGSLRMERIVINLLDTARQETGRLSLKIDWCEIEDLVGTALQQIKKIKQSHPIITQLPDGLSLFRGDFVLLEQVLVNLLDNAMKYSAQGTPITIRAAKEGDNLIVSVIDQGSGLTEEDQLRIFEKFYRASRKNKVAGIGLGLSICKGIIEAHKGRIWAENQPHGGAKISFCIPVSNEATKFSIEEGDYHE